MSAATLPAGPANDFHPTGLLQALLTLSLTAVAVLRPLYATNAQTIEDFAWVYLSPAGQRMLGQPAQPAESLLTRYPAAEQNAHFATYRRAFETGETQHFQGPYQADGVDGYFLIAAQRYEDVLLVSFTDTNDYPRPVVETALRESQAREQAARAEAEAQRQRFTDVLQLLPAQVAIYAGPDHVCTFVNERFATYVPAAAVLGRPVRETAAGGLSEETLARFDQVYQTGEVVQAHAVEVHLTAYQPGAAPVFLDTSYHPLRNPDGRIYGVLDFSYDVTAQVRARRQVEQLNAELEARVQARTQALVEQQRLLSQILGQVPAAIATLTGPAHRFAFFNSGYQDLVAGRAVLGQTVQEALPEVEEQGFIALLDQVYATGQPFIGLDTPAMLHDRTTGQAEQRYVDFIYQPLFDGQQQPQGILAFIVDVTEKVRARKQAETLQTAMLAVVRRQGEERENVYQLFEQAPAAICLLREPDHRIDYRNPAYQALFPGQVLRGRTLAEAQPDNPALVTLLNGIYQAGQPQSQAEVPVAVPQPSGPPQTRYFDFTYQAYREQGAIAGVSLFGTDVTERVLARRRAAALQADVLAAAQRQVREREQVYQVFAQAPAGICILGGPELVFEFVNPAYQRLLPGRELLGRPILAALPELRGTEVDAQLRHVYATGETHQAQELRIPVARPGGAGELEERYFTFIYQARRDEQGQLTGILNFVFEVTEQVVARQLVEQLNQALEARVQARTSELEVARAATERERTQLQALLIQAPVAIGLFEGDELRVSAINPLMAGVLGYAPAQLLGHPLFERAPELQGQGFDALMRQVQVTRVPYVGREVPATVQRQGAPQRVFFNFVYQPLYDAEGQVTGIINVAVDVTEQVLARRQVEELNQDLEARVQARTQETLVLNQELTSANQELYAANEQLTRTNADLDTFVYAASHDLKSPIANIEGLLNALREYLPSETQEPMVPRLVGMMDGAIARFQQTVGHLTDISRLSQPEAAATPTDVAAVLEDVRLDLLPLLESTRTELLLDLAACRPVAFSTRSLRSVLFNLLSNAIKYRAPDRSPRVHLRTHCTATHLALEVQDNGLGLDEKQQAQLFTMFRRLHTHVEGSGVGLYLIKRTLENAGGTIAVHSEPGVGSTFTVTIPLA